MFQSTLKIAALVFFASLTTAQVATAADCVLTTTRTACPGKEGEALKPYGGKNPTEEKAAKATTAEQCADAAKKSAKIIRKGVLSEKKVVANFDGKSVATESDKKDCK